jgi:hypothetical protein
VAKHPAPWVSLDSLWPGESWWRTRGPSITDRCAVVEGTYRDFDSLPPLFKGAISDVRLDVWTTPFRPFITMPPPPPPPPPVRKPNR